MAVYTLEINTVEKPLRIGSLSLNTVVNGRHVLSCAVLSEEGAYRPTVAQTAVLKEDGTPVFGGIIRLVEEDGADGLPIDHISSRITADSFNVLAERRFVTDVIPAGSTLKQALQILDDYLTDYGVTLDAGQLNGPTLDGEQNAYGEALNSVLDTLSQRTGWIWEIDASKTFRMFEPGTEACPINILDSDDPANSTGDIQVTRSRDKYVNRVVVKGGRAVQVDKTDVFTADGVEDTFELTYPLVYMPQVGYGYVWNDEDPANPPEPLYETLDLTGIGSGATWEYDPATNSITRVVGGAPTNLNVVTITYPAQFPIFVVVEDASEIALNGIYEAVFEYPDVYDKPVLIELAESLLSQGLEIKTEVTAQTRATGVLPGQSLTITAADRAVNGEFLITEVNARTEATTDSILRTLKCVEGSVFKGSFRGLIKAWLGNGSTAASIGPPPSSGGGGPHPPQYAVQTFQDGRFYGSSRLLGDLDGSGINYGATGIPSVLTIKTDDNRHHLAIVNDTNGPDEAFTIRQIDGGDTLIEQDGGNDLSVDVYGGGFLSLSAATMTFQVNDYAADYLRMRGLMQSVGLMPAAQRVTSTYTVDSGVGSGGIPDFAVFASGTFVVNLPALASGTVLSGTVYRRLLMIRNIGTGIVTIDADSSETIDGALTKVLAPGQSVILQALTGTDAGWYSMGGSSSSGGGIASVSVTLTDAQIKALPGTPIQVISSPPSGYQNRVIAATLSLDTQAGAYTNVTAATGNLQLETVGGAYVTTPIANDTSLTIDLTRLTDMLTQAHAVVYNCSTYQEDVQYSATSGDWGYLSPVLATKASVEGDAIQIAMSNAAGNLTGGNSANTLKVTAYYAVELL